MFDDLLQPWQREPWRETEALAQPRRELLGMACASEDVPPIETV